MAVSSKKCQSNLPFEISLPLTIGRLCTVYRKAFWNHFFEQIHSFYQETIFYRFFLLIMKKILEKKISTSNFLFCSKNLHRVWYIFKKNPPKSRHWRHQFLFNFVYRGVMSNLIAFLFFSIFFN